MRTLQTQIAWCRKAHWTLTGLMVALMLLFLVLVYRPQMEQLAGLHGQIASADRELEMARSKARTLPTVMNEVARLQNRLERFDKKLPKQQELGQFIRDITQASQQVSVRKWTIQPSPAPRRGELFSEQPIQVQFEGDFGSVFAFLKQAEQMQRLTRIRSLQIRNLDPKLGQVEVQVSMSIYFTEG